MADIKLFSLKGQVKELNSNQVPLEKELQQLLEQNMSTFFGVTFLKSEYRITNGRMDSIGIDENNCPVIFEYKRSVNENVINQGLFYLDWLLDHKADFKLLVMDTLGSEQADKIDWSMPCVICVANDFTKFDDGFVKQTKKSNSKDKDFDQYFNEAGIKNQNLFYSVRDYILSLGDDVSENRLKLYVAFKKVRNIICAEVYRNNVCLHLRLNPDTVDLAQGFIEDVRNKGHWGTGDLRINLKSVEDFEKAKPLLDRAYNEN